MDSIQVFHGPIVHSLSLQTLQVLDNAVLIVDGTGTINALDTSERLVKYILKELGISEEANIEYHPLAPGEFLLPGFIDTHNHAPQWMQRGLGQGMQILDWLRQITFPNEARFTDVEHARQVYSSCVSGFLRQGITTASYYGSLHADATNILAEECFKQGQRGLVGKCNMTRNAPDYYCESSVESSIKDTEKCIAYVRALDPTGERLRYVITPRFAITCHDELLQRLGNLATEEKLPIQTHFNEAEQEMSFTRELFPAFKDEVDIYAHFGLLNERSILAHCCYVSPEELTRLTAHDAGVAHCPIANMTVGGGFMTAPIRMFLDNGIKVGLGTDSGGGFSSSMLDAMRQAMIASNHRAVLSKGSDAPLSMDELLYLATLGGAKVCGMDALIGNFEVGKKFDALWISSSDRYGRDSIMTPRDAQDSLRTLVEKFVMTGDDRNISKVYVNGRSVKS